MSLRNFKSTATLAIWDIQGSQGQIAICSLAPYIGEAAKVAEVRPIRPPKRYVQVLQGCEHSWLELQPPKTYEVTPMDVELTFAKAPSRESER
jgi:hypothetical protein